MNIQQQDDLSICPSFSCYSSDRLSQTAIKIASEHKNDEDEFEFEFEFSAEDLLNNSQIGPVFPVFNQNLDQFTAESNQSITPIPLSQLFLEDREEYDPPSCSSSDADESENIPASIWRPNKPIVETTPATPSRCNKSKSTGSISKRWKFRDLLLSRSNSEGKEKDSFVFLAPKKKVTAKGKTVKSQSPQYEALYVRNRAETEGNKKKSYLPYRKDLVGFFANVNGLRKSLPRF